VEKQDMEKRIKMPLHTTFVGNESPFLDVIRRHSDLNVTVCTRITGKARKFFGSAFDYARKHAIEILDPKEFMARHRPTDLIIVAGYPKLIPRRIIELPSIGIINIHMSLLPAYRGRHPLNWAIINGEKYAGVTIHHISEKFDEGNIICQDRISIKRYDTIADVYAKAVRKGNSLLGKTFRMIGSRQFKGIKQDRRYASYFPPRTPKDGKINWNEPADKIRNLVRALVDPYPGAFFYYRGKKKIVDEVDILPHIQRCDTKIGKPFLLNGCYTIKTCDGFIKLVKLRNSTM